MDSFLKQILNLALKIVLKENDRKEPVLRWREPTYLKQLLDCNLLKENSLSHQELLGILENIVLKFSAKTGHPFFVNQLFSGVDPYGFAGQVITDALNPSVYTYEVAPVFTLMENQVLSAMCQMVGFKKGDGVFCPGGSFSNGFGINLARFAFQSDVKTRGNDPGLVLFASEDAHYSVYKMASFLGIGEENVIPVKVDGFGRMLPGELNSNIERAIQTGLQPFLVFATAGTTVLGAIDPLSELANICERRGLWLHVDAAWGGGLLFSDKHKHLLDGIARADSVTWNPHKLLSVPQQCSVLLTKHSDLLLACHRRDVDYLFQKDKFYDTSYDVGDKYLQCGRRADVLKFWLMWRAKGFMGMQKHVDHLMKVAEYFLSGVKARKGFELVAEPEFVNVCFWFVPDNVREFKGHPDYLQILHKVAPKIKEQMLLRGSMMLNYQPLRQWPNFFRFVVQNSNVTFDDVDFFLNEIERLGSKVSTN